MTPSDANFFVDGQIKPRVYGKTIDEAVYHDWIRALSMHHVTQDAAKQAIQGMVDDGTPFKVSSFRKALKRIKPAGDAEITKPVLLFSIRVQRDHEDKDCPHRDMRGFVETPQWSYAKGFYAPSEKKVPMPETIQFQARYWAQQLKGVIEYPEGMCPIPEEQIPF